jgi:hypothetical protein
VKRSETRDISTRVARPVVIASGAKQSISPLAEAWIASSLALLAMTEAPSKASIAEA